MAVKDHGTLLGGGDTSQRLAVTGGGPQWTGEGNPGQGKQRAHSAETSLMFPPESAW